MLFKDIRRIEEQDCEQEFCTDKEKFDFDHRGQRLDLHFYLKRDRSGSYESYVLVLNSEVRGVLCVQYREDVLYVSRIGVKAGFEHRGYGRRLTKFAVMKAVEHGYRKIRLEAQEEVIAYFHQLGFVIVKRYKAPYWGNAATMELFL